jgi:hypothetical protein
MKRVTISVYSLAAFWFAWLWVTPNGEAVAQVIPAQNTSQIPGLTAAGGSVSASLGAPLQYGGSSVMLRATIYTIFWAPATLQSGTPTSIPSGYRNLMVRFASDYAGHGIANNNTQYYQISTNPETLMREPEYITSEGGWGGSYNDVSPYPKTHDTTLGNCSGDCITLPDIQNEIKRVMTLKQWTGGLDKIFVLYTARGEVLPFSGCGKHSSFMLPDNTPVIYAIVTYHYLANKLKSCTDSASFKYDSANFCTFSNCSPNDDLEADSAVSTTSHEITEAITNPVGGGWSGNVGNSEIADLCQQQVPTMTPGKTKLGVTFGPNTWSSKNNNVFDANQMWNGNFYEIGMVYDNHSYACVQLGPSPFPPCIAPFC